MRNSIIAIFLAAVAGNAAAEWTIIDTDKAMNSYVDMATIRQSTKTVKMWTMVDYSKPQTLGAQTYSSASQLFEFDCSEQRMRVLQISAFRDRMLKGRLVHDTGDTPGNWSYVQPGAVGELQLKIACQSK